MSNETRSCGLKFQVEGYGSPSRGYNWLIRGQMRSSKKKATDDLRSLKATLKEVGSLRKQRDELLAAIKSALEASPVSREILEAVLKGGGDGPGIPITPRKRDRYAGHGTPSVGRNRRRGGINMSKLERWTRPTCYIGKSWPDWYVGLGRHRESDTLDQSNFEVFFREVQAASDKLSINEPDMGWGGEPAEIDSVYIVREGCSLVGWVEWVAIHKDDKGALAKAQSLFDRLNSYPVLDDEHLSNLEDEKINQYWQGCSIRERVDICREAEVSIFAARHEYIVEKAYYWLRDTWM